MNKNKSALAVWCAMAITACSGDGSVIDGSQASGTGSGTGTGTGSGGGTVVVSVVVTMAQLGAQLFTERTLSSTGTQSCASCHDAGKAFTDPVQSLPVSQGAVSGRFGTRNAPTVMYASFVPPLHQESTPVGLRWVGGLFLDGRADDLETQARAPFFNPLEMNLASAGDLHARLAASPVRTAYESVYGAGSLAAGVDEDLVVTRAVAALAEFERSTPFQPFTSKFDAVLAGNATLTPQEALGRDVFTRPDKGGCTACHVIGAGPFGSPPQFSNFTYENTGVPRNPDRRFYAAGFVDTGLEATLLARGIAAGPAASTRGRFRVPTLRNIALTPPYMHNGVFTDLRTVVEFYNTRDSDPARWAAIGAMEVPATVNHRLLGNLGLSAQEVDAVVAFLQTLSDGYALP